MGLKTLRGYVLPAAVGSDGLKTWATGQTLTAADLLAALRDLQGLAVYGMLPGVIAGGVCTASGLVVTVPSGTIYLAAELWWCDGAVTVTVPDEQTSYVWGCADGELRLSLGATTPPVGYSLDTAALLTKATATAGTATVDNTVQHGTRHSDSDAAPRRCIEGALLDLGSGLLIPVLAADPATLVDGMVWFRSDTAQLYVRSGGATRVASAPVGGSFWTSTAEPALSGEVNLGALTSGLLKHSVAAGVSTPATAAAGTDYAGPPDGTTLENNAGTTRIKDEGVTYAKMQHVSATDKVLGRSTAGAGDVEEIACTPFARSILDDVDEATFKATVNLEPGVDVAAQADARFTQIAANLQTANYILALSDAGKVVEMNVAGACTLTVPPNTDVAFPTGTIVHCTQVGAGQVTLTPGTGVTLRNPVGLKTSAQWATVRLRKRATDEWVVDGATAA